MLAKVVSEHHCGRDFDELRWLKLAQSGYANPPAVAVDLQADAGYQHNDQQHDSKDVERRRYVEHFAIVGKSDYQHCDQRDSQSDELLDPIALRRLSITDLVSAKSDNANGQHGQQPIKVS